MIDVDDDLPTFLRRPEPRRVVVVLRDPIDQTSPTSRILAVLLYRGAIAAAILAILFAVWS